MKPVDVVVLILTLIVGGVIGAVTVHNYTHEEPLLTTWGGPLVAGLLGAMIATITIYVRAKMKGKDED